MRTQVPKRYATLEELKLRVASDPDRVQRLIKAKRAEIQKASGQKPVKKPVTDHYIPHDYKTVKDLVNEPNHIRRRTHKDNSIPESIYTPLEEKVLLEKWSKYQTLLIQDQRNKMENYKTSQIIAMNELKHSSQFLYEMACQPDNNLKIKIKGSVRYGPKANYENKFVPIGEVTEVMK